MRDPTIDMTEKQLEAQVKKLAKMCGYLYYHTYRSVRSPAGFPDCVLIKPPRTIYAELKSMKGKVSPDQQIWLDTLAACPHNEVYLWRPDDLEEIATVLSPKEEE